MNFAHIMEANIGLAKCKEKNVIRFEGAVCGKERCVTKQKTTAQETNAKQLVEITSFSGIARVLQTSKENITICVFVVGKFLTPVKSTICYGKCIYLFKQNP